MNNSSIQRASDNLNADAEAEIVNKCLGGDKTAFRYLVERYHKPVINLIYRLTGDKANAEDVAQEVFIKAFNSLGSFRKQSRFFSWLYEITVNQCKDYLKSKKPGGGSLIENVNYENKPGPADKAASTDNMKRIQRALNNLPYEYREAFMLKHIEELSYEQMSDVLKESVANLKVRVHRAREMLAEMLKPSGAGNSAGGGKG